MTNVKIDLDHIKNYSYFMGMKVIRLLTVLLFFFKSLAEGTLPADITFLIVDYKYNKEQGLKICEVQTANVSSFSACDIIYNEERRVYKRLCNFLKKYQTNIWSSNQDLAIKDFIEECKNQNWNLKKNTKKLFNEKSFLKSAKIPVTDPHDLTAYPASIYCRYSRLDPIEQMQKKYPGLLVIDASIFPYQNNKLRMSKLFDTDPTLAKYRPKWKVYPKTYSKTLSKTIADDFNNSTVVIKPLQSSLGKGVIIVRAKDLDKTLKQIFKHGKKQHFSKDPSYQQWSYDKSDSFLVEEFIQSDPITIEHLNNQTFDPTFRAAFALYYHNKKTNIEYFDHLIKLPEKPLTSKGSLNEKHKTIIKQPYYDKVSNELKRELENVLTLPLLKMYEVLLEQKVQG